MSTLGRPPSFTPEIAREICERLTAGESLRAICRDLHMPSVSTVMRWLGDERYTDFREQYAHARTLQADFIFDEILEIADTPQIGVKTKISPMGVETIEGDMIEHRRLQVDARKWYLSKLAPKKYGDKQDINLTGKVDVAATILAARKRSGTS